MLSQRSFLGDTPEAIAALLSRCFENYVVPIHFTPELLSQMIRTESIDLLQSRTFSREGEDVCVAVICRRGDRSRLGAMGIVESARGQGVGAEIMSRLVQEARERADRKLVLEVITTNERAIKLYERTGLVRGPKLFGYAGAIEGSPSSTLERSSPADMANELVSAPESSLSWQLEAPTVFQLTAPWEIFRVRSAFIGINVPEGRDLIAVRAFCMAEGVEGKVDAKELMLALSHAHPGKSWRFTAFFPDLSLNAVLLDCGLRLDEICQFKMEIDLTSSASPQS